MPKLFHLNKDDEKSFSFLKFLVFRRVSPEHNENCLDEVPLRCSVEVQISFFIPGYLIWSEKVWDFFSNAQLTLKHGLILERFFCWPNPLCPGGNNHKALLPECKMQYFSILLLNRKADSTSFDC